MRTDFPVRFSPAPSRHTRTGVACLSLLLTLLAGVPAPRTQADDIDLLRFESTKPYVFVLLDTSTSMCSTIDGEWVEANCDDPRSKMYQAKEVLYSTFAGVDGVHFGFASYNQDQLRVRGKHWLYYVADSPANAAALATLPIDYPRVEPDNVIDVGSVVLDADGNPTGDVDVDVRIDGDLMTFGGTFLDGAGATVPAGSCASPLDLDRDRTKINRYSRLGASSLEITRIWVRGGPGNRTYRLTFENPTAAEKLGKANLNLGYRVERVKNSRNGCDGPSFDGTWDLRLEMGLYREFLMWDDTTSSVVLDPSAKGEETGGYWDWRDVGGNYSCGGSKPFSGEGWEGNYDTGAPFPPPGDEDLDSPPAFGATKVDTYCADASDPATCLNLKVATTRDPTGGNHRELDLGDMLPFNWAADNQDAFLGRINPRHGQGAPDFGTASYFQDSANPLTGVFEPRDAGLPLPLIGGGPSPLSDVMVDFRCWYTGIADNKCKNPNLPYPDGFEKLARDRDRLWECRRPYVILITDGENNCTGESIKADTANLFTKTRTQTWVVNLGTSNVTGIVRNGKGEEVTVESKQELREELQRILGLIEEETRSFASAAVPSVQADVADKIYLTQFTPLNGRSVWPAEVHSFLEPLPIDATTGQPDIDDPAHLWDAGRELVQQAPLPSDITLPTGAAELRLGTGADQRRVYYPLDVGFGNSASGTAGRAVPVPLVRRLLSPIEASGEVANDLREDLWQGFGIVGSNFELGATDPLDPMSAEATKAHAILARTYAQKTFERENPDSGQLETTSYVLGDVFHSNPQVIGGPSNTFYFHRDLFGYRDFVTLHSHRRKILLVGSNDGMLHAFDAGQFRIETEPDRLRTGFGNGTGREVFAYVPRALLGTVAELASQTDHQWGVDGNPTVADVYIDPQHDGTPDPNQREWRTVVIGSLRRGGNAVFALDITQPDPYQEEVKHPDPAVADSVRFAPMPASTSATEPVPQAACQDGPTATPYDVLCDTRLDYPHPLWELTDTTDEEDGGVGNGLADLGQTWSTANVGAIRIVEQDAAGDDVEATRFVAIFGGGYESSGAGGNWLYMVDIETGRVIYKRQLLGSAPAEPAAVDTNQDGYLDRVYLGTSRGFLYRADIDEPVEIDASGRIEDARWEPYVLFDTVSRDSASGAEIADSRKPIFFRPSVVFVRNLGRYALSFGTGNREDLWTYSPVTGNRFYTFVDDSDLLDPAVDLPYTETDFVRLGDGNESEDLLIDRAPGTRGWYLELDAEENERVVTPTTVVSGVVVFATFLPDVRTSDSSEDGLPSCEQRGDSRNYTVFATNGNAILEDPFSGEKSRFREITGSFVSEPFVEQFQTRNESDLAEPLPTELLDVTEALKELFPKKCRFVEAYRFDIKTLRSDTGVEYIASVPVCIIEANWKEL